MIVTWRRYVARRRIALVDLVRSYGLTYEGLVAYFSARGAVPPLRDEPEIVQLFGEQSKTAERTIPDVKSEPPSSVSEKQRRLEVSIKNTKKQLLDIAAKLGLSTTEKMNKLDILSLLKTSEKIFVNEVANIKSEE